MDSFFHDLGEVLFLLGMLAAAVFLGHAAVR
jgi:hypothetical protein